MPGSISTDTKLNGALNNEIDNSNESYMDTNQKWEDDKSSTDKSNAKPTSKNEDKGKDVDVYEESDSSEESMMTANDSDLDEDSSDSNMNGKTDKNDNSTYKDKAIRTNGNKNSQSTKSVVSKKNKSDNVMEINSDSDEVISGEEESLDITEDEDSQSDEESEIEESTKDAENDDTVSIADSDEEANIQKTNTDTTIMLVDSKKTNRSKSNKQVSNKQVDNNSSTVLLDSDDSDGEQKANQKNNDDSDIEEVGEWKENSKNNKSIIINNTKKLPDFTITGGNRPKDTVVVIDTDKDVSKDNKVEQITLQSLYNSIAARGTSVTPILKQDNQISNITISNVQSLQNNQKHHNISIVDTKSLQNTNISIVNTQSLQNRQNSNISIVNTQSLQDTQNSKISTVNTRSLQNTQNANISIVNTQLLQDTQNTNDSIIDIQQSLLDSQNTNISVVSSESLQGILPSLTDDMHVVEAPSFVVPYIYEKASNQPFRKFIDNLKEELIAAKSDLDSGIDDFDVNIDLSSLRNLELEAQKEAAAKKRKPKKKKDDDSWDGMSTDSEDASDDENRKTVVIKENTGDTTPNVSSATTVNPKMGLENKSDNFFDGPLGRFFMNIGMNLVQEHVQKDLLKQMKRKLYKENKTNTGDPEQTEVAISSLKKNIETSCKKNNIYRFSMKKCKFCSFQSESTLMIEHHMETPHMRSNMYTCNFCEYEIKSPHEILLHMEFVHDVKGRLERAPAYNQCPNCPFEDNSKGRLSRHLISCAKKIIPQHTLIPPIEWEPPAKIPKLQGRGRNAPPYHPFLQKTPLPPTKPNPLCSLPNSVFLNTYRGRGRPLGSSLPTLANNQKPSLATNNVNKVIPPVKNTQFSLPNNIQFLQGGQTTIRPNTGPVQQTPVQNQPSISITPLPSSASVLQSTLPMHMASNSIPKSTFVICEICDGYIKDLEQLRNHMMWIHKVKIHPKMIYNRPPLNCQKCQFRFFTDQGLERHLLGSHGLVTSSMQEAANKGKDAGRCPACGRIYQWRLLNHVARDHNMTLKPAHLSYKCTVCTATFGMYKHFESHVYSAHSVVARRVTEKTNKTSPSNTSSSLTVTAVSNNSVSAKISSLSSEALLKPIKINDEITIIPQPIRPKEN